MSTHETITAVSVRCMDKRHTDKVREAIEKHVGQPIHAYELTEPGGAGILNDLFGPESRDWLLKKIELTLSKLHCTEIYLSVHGTSAEDGKPCGGYALSGFTEEFTTPEKSKTFLTEELKKAAIVVKSKLPQATIRAFYITFTKNGDNLLQEVAV
jgi:hypothetical protein